MSIVIIDGSKLKRIKKIEKFLEQSYKYYKGESVEVRSNPRLNIDEKTEQIMKQYEAEYKQGGVQTLENPVNLGAVQNNPETLNMVRDMLKKEGYISVLRADTKHNICVEEVVSADKIFKKS